MDNKAREERQLKTQEEPTLTVSGISRDNNSVSNIELGNTRGVLAFGPVELGLSKHAPRVLGLD